MRRFAPYLLLIFLFPLSALSQEPFYCDGAAYISVVDQGVTTFYETNVGDQDIIQTPINSGFEGNINAIGFSRADSLIYGVDTDTYQLFRIGADGQSEGVRYLPLTNDFYAGDIHPNGTQLVLMNSDFLAFVSLEEVETPISYVPISTVDAEKGIVTTDIAYHPVTGVLYGYDALLGRLITIDDATGLVDNERYPSIQYNNSMPALFFDARGELYGIGTNNADQESILFHFNLETGEAERSSFTGASGDRDACSCPFTVKLFQKLSNEYLSPCSTMELVLTISNLTGSTLEQYQLTQNLPEGYLIKEIVYNPYPNLSPLNEGSNQLSLSDMIIEQGVDSIVILVSIPEDAGGEEHSIQATLQSQNTSNTISYLSDDLVLAAKNDSTLIRVESIETIFDRILPEEVELCEGDTFRLNLPIGPEFEYVWSDSFAGTERLFFEDTNLELEVNTACAIDLFDITVKETNFSLSLGEDLYANQGDQIILQAEAISLSTIVDYDWKTIDGDIACSSCPTLLVSPREDTKYILVAKNESGCFTSDEINVFIGKEIYTPNAFSPNQDGINDLFYIQSGYPAVSVLSFEVYNRWGELVYEASNTFTNDSQSGWDGLHKQTKAANGAYFWTATISFNGKREVYLQGNVLLNR